MRDGRLAILVPNMTGGGTEQIVLRLVRHFVTAGVPTDLLLMEPIGELMPLLPPEVRIVDLKAARIRDTIRPLVGYLRREAPVGLLAMMWPMTVVAVLAGRLARSGTRIVTADHSTLSQQYGGTGRLARLALSRSIRHAYPLAQARVAVSHGVAADLASLSGIDRSSVEVIYNPIETPARPARPDPAIERLWGIERGHRILSVGKLKEEKQQALLIRSFARVADRRPGKLMIVGAGPLRDDLLRVAGECGVGNRVILPGFAIDPWPYFFSADVFALTSRFEGLGLVLVEAMHAGLKIVSTDCESGPREVLDGGRYGTLVEVGNRDAIAAALQAALDADGPPPGMAQRVRDLHGVSSLERYMELMSGRSPVAAGRAST